MKKARLTDTQVENMTPGPKQFDVFEGGRGFGLRVGTSGRRSWFMMYRTEAGRLRRYTFGTYPEMSLGEARTAFNTHLKTLAGGDDPADLASAERRQRKASMTFGALADDYMERHAKRNKRSWMDDELYIEKHLKPAFGERRATSIHRSEVIDLVEQIAQRTPVQANRVLATMRGIYNWAIGAAMVETSPTDRVKPPTKEKPRDRILSNDELRLFWSALTDRVKPFGEPIQENTLPMSEAVALALKFVLVTAQRPGEVANASWFEFDLKCRWWTIPATRSKNGMQHRVPLNKLAMAILARSAAIGRGSGFVFPGKPRQDGSSESVGRGAMTHAMARSFDQIGLAHCTPHDLRRSAASSMTSARIPRLVVSKILNHAERGVTAIYDRHSYDLEKFEAAEAWEAALRRIVGMAHAAEGGKG